MAYSLWDPNDLKVQKCVKLNVSSRLWQSADCALQLPFVCAQLPPATGTTYVQLTLSDQHARGVEIYFLDRFYIAVQWRRQARTIDWHHCSFWLSFLPHRESRHRRSPITDRVFIFCVLLKGYFILFLLDVTAEALRTIICSKSAISLQRGPVGPKFQVERVAPDQPFFFSVN